MENIAASEESEMIYVTKHLGEAPTPELLHRFRCLVNSSGGSQDIAITWLHDSIRRDLRVKLEYMADILQRAEDRAAEQENTIRWLMGNIDFTPKSRTRKRKLDNAEDEDGDYVRLPGSTE